MEDNALLSAPFTEKEVKSAIDNYDNWLDGFNFKFIKVGWSVISEDFLHMLADFHAHGILIRGLNSSFIALIPKKEGTTSLSDYRSTSLMECSKVLISAESGGDG